MSVHALERRARVGGERLRARIRVVANSLARPGERPPFTTALTDREALAFWRRHRFDAVGAEVLARMRPAQIQELDLTLARANEGG
jgi:hypothetical protein